jgi:beta-lactamase class A
MGSTTGGGGRGSTNDVGIFWPPGRPPILVAVYITNTEAPQADRNGAIAAVASRVTASHDDARPKSDAIPLSSPGRPVL